MYMDEGWKRADDLRLLRLTDETGEAWTRPSVVYLFAGVTTYSDGPRTTFRYVACSDGAKALENLERAHPLTLWLLYRIECDGYGFYMEWAPQPVERFDARWLLSEGAKLALPAVPRKPLHPGRKGNWTVKERRENWEKWLAWHEKYDPTNEKVISKARAFLAGGAFALVGLLVDWSDVVFSAWPS